MDMVRYHHNSQVLTVSCLFSLVEGQNMQEHLQAFSDTSKGWALYNGELRHGSNSTGPKYGQAVQAGDIIGVHLDMIEVTHLQSL